MYIFIHTLLSLIQFSKCLLETPGVQILLRAKKTFSLWADLSDLETTPVDPIPKA